MSTWKVLFIAVLGCACLALAFATLIIPLDKVGGQRWLWMGGLTTATVAMGVLFGVFLRYAGQSLSLSSR